MLRYCGVPEELVALIENLHTVYSKSMIGVRIEGELTEWFRMKVGLDRDVIMWNATR